MLNMIRETHLRGTRQTVKLGLIAVMGELFPGYQLQVSYSILEGVFCGLEDSALSVREVHQIEQRLREWSARGEQIEALGQEDGFYVYRVGGVVARVLYPAELDPQKVEPYSLVPFSTGFIVDFEAASPEAGQPFVPPFLLAETFEENRRWLEMLKIEKLEDLNRHLSAGRTVRVVNLAEALHEKQIAGIADTILRQRRALRVLLIAGPSSSGKTTFTQRISTQLEVAGFRPVSLALDNYYRDREHTPQDADGNYDFESLEALDLPLIHEQLHALVAGDPVEVPRFDFVNGVRAGGTELRLAADEVLVIEGIHALNPALLHRVAPGAVFKTYVSALGGLNLDRINRIPTTEIRLLRRLVRDERTRGIAPEQTLTRWEAVRRGEYQNVFRFQEEADVMFNSSLLYELNALRPHAEHALTQIPDTSAHVATRDRLLNLIRFFEPVDPTKIPFNSILREFIGGSAYDS